jgi:hypothetical protein
MLPQELLVLVIFSIKIIGGGTTYRNNPKEKGKYKAVLQFYRKDEKTAETRSSPSMVPAQH